MFEFGKNWNNYSKKIRSKNIHISIDDLKYYLGIKLKNKKFLDIGCGSGLSSLAACKLGARVTSFDVDNLSTATTIALKKKYLSSSKKWKILNHGNVLDKKFCKNLGKFDIIYAWGVLHHTGNLWLSLRNIFLNSKKNTIFFIALYNDEGFYSRVWWIIKKIYDILYFDIFKKIYFIFVLIFCTLKNYVFTIANITQSFKDLKILFKTIKNYEKSRGMSYWNDQLDWIGGYPFEVSKPEKIIKFFRNRKCKLLKIFVNHGYGNNIYVFKKEK